LNNQIISYILRGGDKFEKTTLRATWWGNWSVCRHS